MGAEGLVLWCLSFSMQVPVKAIAGKLYVRVSVHIYNEMDDFKRLANAINDIRKETWQCTDVYNNA